MNSGSTFVGLDVHKASIFVAVLRSDGGREEWQVENKPAVVARLAKRLNAFGHTISCYEAGPCGFALMRQLQGLGLECYVIAPSLIPRKPGERIKTDRRDARKLAEMLRANLLTFVVPPTPEQEAVRDLCRARDDVRSDRMAARHRLGKFLLRHGRTFEGKSWTLCHRAWLEKQKFERSAEQMTFDVYMGILSAADQRIADLDRKVTAIAETPEYKDAVGVLRCFRGIETVTAMVFLSELGDIARFENAPALMGFLGVTPSEHSSGGPAGRRLGAITKSGNGYVRRLLIEAAWHYRHAPRTSLTLRRRRAGQPEWAIRIAERCQLRLCARHRHLIERGKPSAKANTAIARELAGFVWAALTERRKQAA